MPAMLPSGLLAENETPLLLTRPSKWFIVLMSAKLALIMSAIIVIGFIVEPSPRERLLLTGIALLAVTTKLLWGTILWLNITYVLTPQQVIAIGGVFNTQTRTLPLANVQHTTVSRSFLQQMLGLGNVTLTTAGTGGIDLRWAMVRHPHAIHAALRDAMPAPSTS